MSRFDGFEEIQACQKAYDITLRIYRLTENGCFGKDFGLKGQIRRASVSIMANIAEGHGRRSNTEFANFLNLARGSTNEVQSRLHIAVGPDYIKKVGFEELYGLTLEISKMTLALARYLQSSQNRTSYVCSFIASKPRNFATLKLRNFL